MRAIFYFLMASMQDKETLVNGGVAIYYGVGQKKVHVDRPYAYIKTFDAIPFRMVGGHYCKNSGLLDAAVQSIIQLLQSRSLCRMRFHVGESCDADRAYTFVVRKLER